MAKSSLIYCKTCAKKTKHWDNKGTPKEKTLGHFVCSVCKTAYNPKPRSEGYSKPAGSYNKTSGGSSYYKKADYGDSVPKSMYGAWANNMVIALIEKGTVVGKEQAVEVFNELVSAYGKILNNTTTSAPSSTTNTDVPVDNGDVTDGELPELDDFEAQDSPDEGIDLDLSDLEL
jgi:hypothetical protein